ncbi:alpha-L-fucosidase [Mytilus galloprovincialis]|uniref:alpha-L-fucosidase n=1 Tax=Mytilus galloprovincialis TaxID=29158 RepID=A0A8B6BGS5_MYTGA|nr:alpha-L-fucosidase [Mytilus galloprovincialis]
MTAYLICVLFLFSRVNSLTYDPTWDSLDTRPLPPWFDDAKLGIFIHWGVFSVPAFLGAGFWWSWKGQPLPAIVDFMQKNYRPDFTYAEFAAMFTTELFNPEEWAEMFQDSGARYVVLVSKHHEGYTNWPSKYSFNWNSNATGPNRDLVGELSAAIREKTHMKFGIYHSLFEWFNPIYLDDKHSKFKKRNFVRTKTMPELYELVNAYKPEIVWSDGDWEATDAYWNSTNFLAWLYNESPVKDTVVTNDRWGSGIPCKHGGFFTCTDRFNPGKLQTHKWENAMTIDKHSWSYRRDVRLEDFLTIEDLLSQLVSTVSCGGNMLMNVGPTKYGKISPIYEERLRQLGQWLRINGDGIYETRPWIHQNDTVTNNVWFTMKKAVAATAVYAILLEWPDNNLIKLGAPITSENTTVSMLGYPETLVWTAGTFGKGINIQIPYVSVKTIPCQWAWTFKMTGLQN